MQTNRGRKKPGIKVIARSSPFEETEELPSMRNRDRGTYNPYKSFLPERLESANRGYRQSIAASINALHALKAKFGARRRTVNWKRIFYGFLVVVVLSVGVGAVFLAWKKPEPVSQKVYTHGGSSALHLNVPGLSKMVESISGTKINEEYDRMRPFGISMDLVLKVAIRNRNFYNIKLPWAQVTVPTHLDMLTLQGNLLELDGSKNTKVRVYGLKRHLVLKAQSKSYIRIPFTVSYKPDNEEQALQDRTIRNILRTCGLDIPRGKVSAFLTDSKQKGQDKDDDEDDSGSSRSMAADDDKDKRERQRDEENDDDEEEEYRPRLHSSRRRSRDDDEEEKEEDFTRRRRTRYDEEDEEDDEEEDREPRRRPRRAHRARRRRHHKRSLDATEENSNEKRLTKRSIEDGKFRIEYVVQLANLKKLTGVASVKCPRQLGKH